MRMINTVKFHQKFHVIPVVMKLWSQKSFLVYKFSLPPNTTSPNGNALEWFYKENEMIDVGQIWPSRLKRKPQRGSTMKNKLKIKAKDKHKCLWGILNTSSSNVVYYIEFKNHKYNKSLLILRTILSRSQNAKTMMILSR